MLLMNLISILGQFPYVYKVYRTIRNTEKDHRLFPVKTFAVFYVVNEELVEIHRILYMKKDLSNIINESLNLK